MRTAIVLLVTVILVFTSFFLFYPRTPSSTTDRTNEVTPIEVEGTQIVQGPMLGRNASEAPDDGLVDQDGNAVRFEELKGQPILLSFIYTSCPDPEMCPLITRKMVQVQEKVNADDRVSAQFVSITFDPETDRPETLKHYGERRKVDFRNWVFLTGPSKTISRLTEWFKVKAQSNEEKEDVLLHNMRTYVLDEDLTVKYAWKKSNWPEDEVFEKIKSLQ